jgi:polyferredoxin
MFIAAPIMIFRPFCRVICPLGAFYALFNAHSLWRFEFDASRCTACGMCSDICPMDIKVTENPNDHECIRCMRCSSHCPGKAISYTCLAPVPGSINRESADTKV